MNTPNLRIVSDQVAEQANDAMHLLGDLRVANVLGTYQANKDAADALLNQCLSLHDAGETQSEHSRRLWGDLEHAQRRLWIYSMLATEALS